MLCLFIRRDERETCYGFCNIVDAALSLEHADGGVAK
jgi:hypothetical protein